MRQNITKITISIDAEERDVTNPSLFLERNAQQNGKKGKFHQHNRFT